MSESPDQVLPSLGLAWIDAAGLALVCTMFLLGAIRGLWWQIIRFLGLLGAIALASSLSQRFSPVFEQALSDIPSGFVHGATWMVVFLAGLAAAALVGLTGRKLLMTMSLGLADRAGGALVGLATGVLIHIPLVALLVQVAPPDWAARNLAGTFSTSALDAVGRQWKRFSDRDAERRSPNAPDASAGEEQIESALVESH